MMYDTRAYTPDGSGHGTGQASNDKELVLQAIREYGRSKAAQLQEASAEMTGTELYATEDYIPDFAAACARKNMLERAAGRVVRLPQPYDSTIYTDEPETLPAQWGFVWSTDPYKALPFIELATSPYNTGDGCTYPAEDETLHVYRSGQDGNVWPPRAINVKCTDLGPVGGPFVEEEA